jgi:hypothetical protein
MISGGIRVSPEVLVQHAGQFYIDSTIAQAGRALFVMFPSVCGIAALKPALDEITSAVNVFYMIADGSPRAKRLTADQMPSLFLVRWGGALVPYKGPRDSRSLATIALSG